MAGSVSKPLLGGLLHLISNADVSLAYYMALHESAFCSVKLLHFNKLEIAASVWWPWGSCIQCNQRRLTKWLPRGSYDEKLDYLDER